MNEKLFHHSKSEKLDAADRLQWMPPGDVVSALDLVRGQTIADIGAGTGYFAIPLAKATGPAGKVLAVDLQPEMLDKLRARLEGAEGPKNIVLSQGQADATGLSDACADLVLLANIWHEIDDRSAALIETRRVLKPKGRVAILDWRTDVERVVGPPFEHRVSLEDAKRDLETGGFAVRTEKDIGKYSYLLVADAPR